MKFALALALFCLIALATAKRDKADYDKKFKDFQAKFNKKYNGCPKATAKAMERYQRKLDKIDEHNERFAAGLEDYDMAEYEFDDEDPDEAIAIRCRTQMPPTARALPQTSVPYYPTGPASSDWRSILLPVIDQKTCGSCWAFSTVAQLESLYKRKNPAFNTPLSAQYLVDCSRNGNSGCNGGWPKYAFDYVKSYGIPANLTCPYKNVQATCKSYPLMSSIISTTYQYDLNGNEVTAKNVVASEGPVVIAVYVGQNFMNYKSGIFYDSLSPTSCSYANHGVVLAGYGTDYTLGYARDFWLVRNSWGSKWGELGYIRIARNRRNNCLVACSLMFAK